MSNALLEAADPTDLERLRKIIKEADPENVLCDIEMKSICIQKNAVELLPQVVRSLTDGQHVLLVCDDTPIYRRGANVKDEAFTLLSGSFNAEKLVLSEEGGLHATDTNSKFIQGKLPGFDCVVCVGSGTVTDLCKNATYEYNAKVPLIAVQTALSVNAFSDGVSVMLINGVKRTMHARYPSALLIDLDIISAAPPEMNISGYGDLVSTWTAPVDWLLSYTIGMTQNYHDAPADMIRTQCNQLLANSEKLAQGDPKVLDDLARVLTLSGLSMGIAGESSPCSGSEHVMSHLIDMSSPRRNTGICYHGTQVAVSSIISSIAWDIFLNEFDPKAVNVDACYPGIDEMRPKVLEAFSWLDDTGDAAQECLRDYEKKLASWHADKERFISFLNHFEEFRAQARKIVKTPETICDCMHKANAPTRYSKLNYFVDGKTAKWAMRCCHMMRNRFSIIDLLYYTGWWNDDIIERILRRAESLDAGL